MGHRCQRDQGCTATSYEMKLTRSDFLKDVKQPLKQRGARLFSDQFFFVTPPDLLKPEEIPDWAGLLEPYADSFFSNWATWSVVVPAPIRSKDAPSWPWWSACCAVKRSSFMRKKYANSVSAMDHAVLRVRGQVGASASAVRPKRCGANRTRSASLRSGNRAIDQTPSSATLWSAELRSSAT